MYYLAKIAQATGLTILLIEFMRHFPHLMSYKALGVGIVVFTFGWTIQYFLLKK